MTQPMTEFQKEMARKDNEEIVIDKSKKHKKIGLKDVGENGIEDNPLKNYWVGEMFNILVFAVMSLVPIGLLTLLDPQWSWAMYLSWLFWVDYLTIQGVSWYGRWWIFSTRTRYLLLTDTVYLKNESQIQTFVDKDHDEPFIDEYADVDNRERKTRAWRRKIKRKLIRLNNRWHINNMSEHFKLTQNGINIASTLFVLKSDKLTLWINRKGFRCIFKPFVWFHNLLSKNKQRKLNNRINRLFGLITDDWIINNIDTIKVLYSKVSKSVLVNGFTPKQTVNDEANYKTDSAKVFLSETMPMFIFVSLIMFLIVPLFGSGLSKDLNAWGMFLTKIALVASSIFMVWLNSKKMFRATEVKAVSERNTTLNKYWKRYEAKKIKQKELEAKELELIKTKEAEL